MSENLSLVERVGRGLYGVHWAADLAATMGVARRTVQRWRHPRPGEDGPGAPLLRELLALMEERAEELGELRAEVRAALDGARSG